MRSPRRYVLGAAGAALALIVAACGSSSKTAGDTTPKETVKIASFSFPESPILAAIYEGALRADGVSVTVQPNLGPRPVVAPAMERGDIDLYPGYAASDLEYYNNSAHEASADTASTVEKLRARLASKGLTALDPSPAIDTNAFAVTKATAEKYKLRTLSDLAPVSGQLVFGAPSECVTNAYCQPGLEQTYGIKFKELKPLDIGPGANSALERGDIDVAEVLSTDGGARNAFVLLEDDKKLQNADNVIPIIRTSAASDKVRKVLNKVSAALTTDDLAQLDKRSDADKEDPEVLAKDWLKKHGF